MRPTRAHFILIVFWLLVAIVYVIAAAKQKQCLNLSATAGGQYPYLVYAKGMAEKGWFEHVGDRNRMPLYPAFLSLVYDNDWDRFVERAAWFAIASSLMALMAVGVASYVVLPIWSATALTLSAALGIYLPTASFVQADRWFFALFYITWILLCAVMRKRSPGMSLAAGAAVGACFLMKASTFPLLMIFIGMAIISVLVGPSVDRAGGEPSPTKFPVLAHRALLGVFCVVLVVLVFLTMCFPYLRTSKERFGSYFYNVNSTHYMWCDSWSKAKAFGDAYGAEVHQPHAPVDATPSLANYWRTHSLGQILQREWAGVRLLAKMALDLSVTKYVAVTTVFASIVVFRRRQRALDVLRGQWPIFFFTVLVVVAYVFAYAWYAILAYGERFMLSLYLPVMCGLLWLVHRFALERFAAAAIGFRGKVGERFAQWMCAVLIVDGTYVISTKDCVPDKPFVQFYYDESRVRELAGDLQEAKKGYSGVLRLSPGFVPAMHGLGMIKLRHGRFTEAVDILSRAVQLEPNSADLRNSLGSALIHADRPIEAVAHFQRAVELDPQLAAAWMNLGGTYVVLGQLDDAKVLLTKLRPLDSSLVQRLQQMIQDVEGQAP